MVIGSPPSMATSHAHGLSSTIEPLGSPLAHRMAYVAAQELKLSDLKQLLLRSGGAAEVAAGVLVANGEIEVRKPKPHTLVVQGPHGANFLQLRKLLYSQLAAV